MAERGTGPELATDRLSGTLRRGAAISAAVLVFTQLVSLGQTLIIARLLQPAEVGLFAAGTVLAAFLLTFSEGGLRNALVQRENDLDAAANTVFWATLGTGVLWAAIAASSAPLVSWWFADPTAGLVALATAGTIVLNSLTNVPDSLMQRRFDFRQRLIVQPSNVLTFAVVSVLLCANGFGVWGLVIASYSGQLVWVLTSWALAGWRPGAGPGRPSVRVWRELATFSLPLVVWNVVNRARDLLETSIVGGALSATALGHYRYGRRLGSVPEMAIIEVGSYVLFPAFSRIAGDPQRLRAAFLRALRVLWCLAMPVAGFFVAAGEPAVTVLLGENWRGAGVMLVALAGVGPGVALSAIGMESIKGVGRTRLLNWVTLVATGVGLGLLVVLLPLGLTGVGLALSVSTFAAGLLSLLLARRLVGVPLRELVVVLLGPLVPAVGAAIALGVAERTVGHADQRGFLLGLLTLLVEGGCFLAVYLAGLRLAAPATWAELASAVRQARPR
jgi:O-antigen/teichoic acid export membrane protein